MFLFIVAIIIPLAFPEQITFIIPLKVSETLTVNPNFNNYYFVITDNSSFSVNVTFNYSIGIESYSVSLGQLSPNQTISKTIIEQAFLIEYNLYRVNPITSYNATGAFSLSEGSIYSAWILSPFIWILEKIIVFFKGLFPSYGSVAVNTTLTMILRLLEKVVGFPFSSGAMTI